MRVEDDKPRTREPISSGILSRLGGIVAVLLMTAIHPDESREVEYIKMAVVIWLVVTLWDKFDERQKNQP